MLTHCQRNTAVERFVHKVGIIDQREAKHHPLPLFWEATKESIDILVRYMGITVTQAKLAQEGLGVVIKIPEPVRSRLLGFEAACDTTEVNLPRPQESSGTARGAACEVKAPSPAPQDHAPAHVRNAPRESTGSFSVPETHHDVEEVEIADKEGAFPLSSPSRLFFSVSCCSGRGAPSSRV